MRTFVAIGLVFFLTPLLFAETPDVGSWFHTAPVARSYADVQSDVEQVFSLASKSGLPLSPLMDRLWAGAAKGVPGDVLVGALRAESARLLQARDVLQRQSVFFPESGDRDSALGLISLALLSGLSPENVESIFSAARIAGRSPAAATAAVDTLVQAKLSRQLSDGQLQKLGLALVRSRLPQTGFNSIFALLARARAGGLTDDQIIDKVAAEVLASGGEPSALNESPLAPRERRGQAASNANSPSVAASAASASGAASAPGLATAPGVTSAPGLTNNRGIASAPGLSRALGLSRAPGVGSAPGLAFGPRAAGAPGGDQLVVDSAGPDVPAAADQSDAAPQTLTQPDVSAVQPAGDPPAAPPAPAHDGHDGHAGGGPGGSGPGHHDTHSAPSPRGSK